MQQTLPPTTVSAQIWRLVWPIMLSNLTVPLLGAIDTAILGHLPSPTYLGAVALGTSILSLGYWSFGFLRMGTTSLVARADGEGRPHDSLYTLMRSAMLALVIAVILLLSQNLLIPLALRLMDITTPVMAELTASYCRIRLYSAPATLISYALIGWFIGRQNTRATLIMLVCSNTLNLCLDMLFIWELGWNSDGAAWASVIAEYAGMALGIYLLCLQVRTFRAAVTPKLKIAVIFHLQSYWPLLQINRHLFIRTLCLLWIFAFVAAKGAALGPTILAANAILLQFLFLSAYSLDGFAHAAEALCGKAIGSGNMTNFFTVCRISTKHAAITALIISVCLLLGQNFWLSLFSETPSVLETAQHFFPWIIVLPIVSIWAYQFDGIFLGSGKSLAMQNSVLVATSLVFIPTWWFFSSMGNHGLWLALTLFNASRGALLWLLFIRYTHTDHWRA